MVLLDSKPNAVVDRPSKRWKINRYKKIHRRRRRRNPQWIPSPGSAKKSVDIPPNPSRISLTFSRTLSLCASSFVPSISTSLVQAVRLFITTAVPSLSRLILLIADSASSSHHLHQSAAAGEWSSEIARCSRKLTIVFQIRSESQTLESGSKFRDFSSLSPPDNEVVPFLHLLGFSVRKEISYTVFGIARRVYSCCAVFESLRRVRSFSSDFRFS